MERKRRNPLAWIAKQLAVLGLALATTAAIFLFLPVMQTIGSPDRNDLEVRSVGVARYEPPPPTPEPEPEPEEEDKPEETPQLDEQVAPVDLSQLELALDPGFGGGAGGDFKIDLGNELAGADRDEQIDQIFSLADLDQRPRVIFQRTPTYPPDLRKQGRQGTVYVVFTVDTRGKVVDPKVEKSTDPAFERSAVDAVRQWRFEPGTRGGEKVQFRIRIPITFNASS